MFHDVCKKGVKIKYIPRRIMVEPAIFLNHRPAPFHKVFSSSFFTRAVELPATRIGRQWPRPNMMIRIIPVRIFCCMVMMARIGAINPKVHEPERMP